MTLQLSVACRDAGLDAYETATGASPKLRLYTGAAPANCATADAGTPLAELDLPADWMAAASSGSKAFSGPWNGTGGSGAGTGTDATHFRVLDAAGTTCHWQGTVSVTGGGGDMTLDNVNIADGQAFTINGFTVTAGNA